MRTGSRHTVQLLLAALAMTTFAGCFRSPDMGRLSCTKTSSCPNGQNCAIPSGQIVGICQKSADGGSPDQIGAADALPTIDVVVPADGTASIDTSKPATDLVVGPDLGPATDPAPDSAPEVQVAPEVGPEATPDTVLPTDRSGDRSTIVPGDTSPDIAPDLPSPPPDLAPDLPAKKDLGASCRDNSECASTYCVTGVCCNRSCTGACEQCTAASGGQCSYKNGTECLAATSCTNTAVCSGSSASCPTPAPKPPGTPCGTITCSGSTQSGPTCNGSGSCEASTNKECYPFACVSGSGCKTSCATNADCVSNNSTFCGKNGVCTTCAKGALACGGCLAWDFESGPGSTSGWVIGGEPNAIASGNGATNLQISSTKTNPQNVASQYSLAVPVAIYESNMVPAAVTVPLCQAGGPINLAGYTLTAAVYLAGPAFAWTGGMHVNTYGPGGVYDWGVQMFNPLKNDDWNYLSYTFSQSLQVDHVSIQLDANEYWVGTMYIDDVVITGL